ncbi:MAG: hypothetical protein LBI11_07385 [Streptococcaceae bacterium]|jgi:hypothetical protein|nr:hypothetical protein [Streptococcaceae bacterium]
MVELVLIIVLFVMGIVYLVSSSDAKSEDLLKNKLKPRNRFKKQYDAAMTDEEKAVIVKKFTRGRRLSGAAAIVLALIWIAKIVVQLAFLTSH